ncbi:MAG: glycosyltransferase family 2 protein [Pseudomonadota bacterium]
MAPETREVLPVVSILMPAFNAEATLAEAVASVQAQSFQAWELLIADDGSLDGTYAVAADLAGHDTRIRIVRHDTRQGAAAARNTALATARGRYVAFLDADDLWRPDKLTRQIDFMRDTGAALTFSAYWRAPIAAWGTMGAPAGRVIGVPPAVDRQTLMQCNVIGCLTGMYDREILGGCPMPALPVCEDFALWLEILEQTDRARGLNEPLAIRRVRDGSLTSHRMQAMGGLWRMYRQHFGLGIAQSLWFCTNHLLRRLGRG